jgi:Spy/CpxP family protein refolding chaperone
MGAFGIRRPLRFLSHKLDLSEEQVQVLAAVLDDLKTERAQADVDRRRAQKLVAEALSGDAFDDAKAAEATKLCADAAERVQKVTAEGLKALHAVLDEGQRQRLAMFLRAGPPLM